MRLEDFRRWDVAALKHYLSQRDLSQQGRKEELVARVFAAHEQNIPVKITQQQREQTLEKEYLSLLNTDEGQLPDPFGTLENSWIGEKEGMKLWPPTMIQDISVYLCNHDVEIEKVSLSKRLLTDYKEQKAYSYFCSKFVFEVYYNCISTTSNYCFIKSKCTPSQRINDVPHELWICIEKDTGKIHSAYCSCFAGLGQSCNHVTAVLLKIDFSWQFGDVQKACTSQPCTWSRPGGKSVKVQPMCIKDLDLVKPKASKTGQRRSLNSEAKAEFRPHEQEKGMSFAEFLKELENIDPESVTLGERSETRNPVYESYDRKFSSSISFTLPRSIADLATDFDSADEFIQNIPLYTPGMLAEIEKATKDQSLTQVWHNQREGRITASNFHKVHTRMETWKKNQEADMSSLTGQLLKYSSPPESLHSLKYGRRMEQPAIECYTQIMKRKHKNLSVKPCGLFVSADLPFLGATPDQMVQCACCGQGALEVKCPLSCAHMAPSPSTVPYLLQGDNGEITLRKTHAYYSQVQGQLALANAEWGDFFVYTSHGHCVTRVSFDPLFWETMKANLSNFFQKFLAPELVTRQLQKQLAAKCVDVTLPSVSEMSKIQESPGSIVSKESESSMTSETSSAATANTASNNKSQMPSTSQSGTTSTTNETSSAATSITQIDNKSHMPCTSQCGTKPTTNEKSSATTGNTYNKSQVPSISQRRTKPKKPKTQRKKKCTFRPVYLCGICQKKCEDVKPGDPEDKFSIWCDSCSKWNHYKCVGLKHDSPELEADTYCCPRCQLN